MGARGLDLLEQGPLPQCWETPAPFFFAGRQGVCKLWGTAALPTRGSVPQNLVSEFSDCLHRFCSKGEWQALAPPVLDSHPITCGLHCSPLHCPEKNGRWASVFLSFSCSPCPRLGDSSSSPAPDPFSGVSASSLHFSHASWWRGGAVFPQNLMDSSSRTWALQFMNTPFGLCASVLGTQHAPRCGGGRGSPLLSSVSPDLVYSFPFLSQSPLYPDSGHPRPFIGSDSQPLSRNPREDSFSSQHPPVVTCVVREVRQDSLSPQHAPHGCVFGGSGVSATVS